MCIYIYIYIYYIEYHKYYLCVYIYTIYIYIYIYYLCVYIYIHTKIIFMIFNIGCIYIYIYIYTHTHYIEYHKYYLCVCVCIYIYIYIYILNIINNVLGYIYIYIYIYKLKCVWSRFFLWFPIHLLPLPSLAGLFQARKLQFHTFFTSVEIQVLSLWHYGPSVCLNFGLDICVCIYIYIYVYHGIRMSGCRYICTCEPRHIHESVCVSIRRVCGSRCVRVCMYHCRHISGRIYIYIYRGRGICVW